MTKTITWNGVASSTIPELIVGPTQKTLVGSHRGTHVPLPGRAGSWYFDEQPGTREIIATCNVLVDDMADRGTVLTQVADWYDVREEAALVLSETPDRFYLATIGEPPTPDEWRQLAEFELRWIAQPFAFASAVTTEAIAISGASPASGTFSAPDDFEAWPIIEITPTNGTITAFVLTLNGDALSYDGPTITSGNTVTVSSISDTVTSGVNGDTMLTGAYTGLVVMGGVFGVFPLVVNSTNSWQLAWSGTATAIDVNIYWRRRYR